LERCLAEISKYGTTKLFSEVAFEIAKEQGLLARELHLDSTSLTLYRDYSQATGEEIGPLPA
jgi:hypothetical protein